MHIWPDCVPCITKMGLELARLAFKDEQRVQRFVEEMLKLPPLRGENWNTISPRVVREIWRKVTQESGKYDPMREIKVQQNRKALEMYPMAKELVAAATDPFLTALKLAIVGNSLDAMVSVKDDGAQGMVKSLDSLTIRLEEVKTFRVRLSKAHTILYFTDNCGEIVFDKLFLETLHTMYDLKVTAVTRTVPILNDALLKDAEEISLSSVAALMENGIQDAIAGTIVAEVSPSVRSLIDESNLLIAKGVGNYDAFTEETWLKGRLTMLFHGKCHPCCDPQGAALGDLVVYNF
jgi:damage-control phosphatase, subfamily I